MGSLGEHSSSLLLSQAAKAEGVPCSPAQLYFLALEQVWSPGATASSKVPQPTSYDIAASAVLCLS